MGAERRSTTPAGSTDLQRLTAAVEGFCGFVGDLPPDLVSDSLWGPKEILVHLVSHHERYVRLIRATVRGARLPPPSGTFAELNAEAVRANSSMSVSRLVRRFRQANQALCDFYADCDPKSVVVEIKAGAKPRSFDSLVVEIEAHVRDHLLKLRKALAAGRIGGAA
jgi:hypothetical protein